jgi:hypothetical protein
VRLGEVFSEVLYVSGKEHTVEWNVLDRQIPSSSTSQHAEFSLEGLAQPGGPGQGETWRETIRLRAGLHQHAKTPYVTVEVELEAAGARKDGGDAARKWRKQLLRGLKGSLTLLRDRLNERTRAKAAKAR